ncbi:MAG: hypothetical protein ACUVWN_16555 [bacterium]
MLTALLAVEAEAREIVEKSEKEARDIREKTRREVQKIIESARLREEQEINQALENARNQAEMGKKSIMDQVNKEIQRWEELYQKNREKTIKFILDSIL